MNRLDRIISKIRKHQNKAPVDIIAIARELGISVYRSKEAVNVAGRIIHDQNRGGSSGFAIFVNSADVPRRQRFTIAHEIAHFILHSDLIGDGITDDALYRSGLSNKMEVEANKSAADILMPFHLVNSALSRDSTVKALADKFGVSESAMSIRLGVPA